MLGREHRGQKGDYLVESSDGMLRIAPRDIFEDVYVPMGAGDSWSRPDLGSGRDFGMIGHPNRGGWDAAVEKPMREWHLTC